MSIHSGVKKDNTGKVTVDATVANATINGGLVIGSTAAVEEEGAIRWDTTAKKYQYYNGTNWVYMGAGSGGGGGISFVFGLLEVPTTTYPIFMDTEPGEIFAEAGEAP